MNIKVEMKPEQQSRHLGKDANTWPDSGVWRVVVCPASEVCKEDFEEGDLLLIMRTQYRGYSVLNLTKSRVYTGEIKNGQYIQVKKDFSVRQVQLYVDEEDKP